MVVSHGCMWGNHGWWPISLINTIIVDSQCTPIDKRVWY